ncbi:hypothetical protein RYX36_013745, partial [Vicia faba]
DENLGIPARISSLIQIKKWCKLCQHPKSYNIQIVNDFYSNLKPANKKLVVLKVEEEYHDILERADETEYEVYM